MSILPYNSWNLSFGSVEEKMNREGKGGWYLEKDPSRWSFARGLSIWMIICKRPVHQDDHLQETCPSEWSFARGQSVMIIICKGLVHQDDHLQEAGLSGSLLALENYYIIFWQREKRWWHIMHSQIYFLTGKDLKKVHRKKSSQRYTGTRVSLFCLLAGLELGVELRVGIWERGCDAGGCWLMSRSTAGFATGLHVLQILLVLPISFYLPP